MNTTISIIFVILSIAGLILSTYVHKKKAKKEKLICILGKNCDKVVNSKYGKTFGLDNDIMGIIYFIALLISSAAFIIYPSLLTENIEFLRIIIVGISVLFSIYLTAIQLFVLKDLCEYCMGANIINVIIFILLFL